MKTRAFTFVEVILVIAIMAVIAGSSVALFGTAISRNDLKTVSWELQDTLVRARMHSMTGRNDQPWGVHFETGNFVLFKGTPFSSTEPSNEEHDLPNSLSFTSISLNGGGSEIIFDKGSADTSQYGSVTLEVNGTTNSVSLTVNAVGMISNPL